MTHWTLEDLEMCWTYTQFRARFWYPWAVLCWFCDTALIGIGSIKNNNNNNNKKEKPGPRLLIVQLWSSKSSWEVGHPTLPFLSCCSTGLPAVLWGMLPSAFTPAAPRGSLRRDPGCAITCMVWLFVRWEQRCTPGMAALQTLVQGFMFFHKLLSQVGHDTITSFYV